MSCPSPLALSLSPKLVRPSVSSSAPLSADPLVPKTVGVLSPLPEPDGESALAFFDAGRDENAVTPPVAYAEKALALLPLLPGGDLLLPHFPVGDFVRTANGEPEEPNVVPNEGGLTGVGAGVVSPNTANEEARDGGADMVDVDGLGEGDRWEGANKLRPLTLANGELVDA